MGQQDTSSKVWCKMQKLQSCCDQLHLIHQAHVRAIYEASSLRDSNAHNVAAPHSRALKAMDYEPSGKSVTSILELKLDPATMFEWQSCRQISREVPHYTALLEFLDLWARASENTCVILTEDVRQLLQRRSWPQSFRITSTSLIPVWLANRVNIPCTPAESSGCCHTSKWWPFQRTTGTALTVWNEDMVKECPCGQRCRKCKKPHHSWLHIDKKAQKQTKGVSLLNQTPGTVMHHSQLGGSHPVVLTWRVQIVRPDGSTTKAGVLLDSASSTLFIIVTVPLHKIGGISSSATRLSSHEIVHLNIPNRGKIFSVKINKAGMKTQEVYTAREKCW